MNPGTLLRPKLRLRQINVSGHERLHGTTELSCRVVLSPVGVSTHLSLPTLLWKDLSKNNIKLVDPISYATGPSSVLRPFRWNRGRRIFCRRQIKYGLLHLSPNLLNTNFLKKKKPTVFTEITLFGTYELKIIWPESSTYPSSLCLTHIRLLHSSVYVETSPREDSSA